MDKPYKVRDPVHGFIYFSEFEKKIIDSFPFQRLRRISQLGFTSYVYPGATHTRFEHSLGVMEVASLIFSRLTRDSTSISNIEEAFNFEFHGGFEWALRIAALIHDLGHSPFSHGPEEVFPLEGDVRKKHEDYTDEILKETGLAKLIDRKFEELKYDYDHELIAKISVGEERVSNESAIDKFLSNIITGQLGADRIDYLLRDSIHTGVEYGKFDYLRLIDTLRVLEEPERISDETPTKDSKYESTTPGKEHTLGIDVGGIHAAEGLILARYFMFTQVYFHRTRRVFDYHLVDYLKDCLPDGVFPLSATNYLKYDDVYILSSLLEESPENIYKKRLLNREHLRNVRDISKEEIAEDKDALEGLKTELKEKIGEDNIIIDSPLNTPYASEAPTFPVYDSKRPEAPITDIKNKSEVIKSLPEKIDIIRIYSPKEKKDEVNRIVNDIFKGGSDG